MNLETRFTSVLGDLNPKGFSVIRTTPAGSDWFVAVDEETMAPIHESESLAEVEEIARWHMQARDLAFIAWSAGQQQAFLSRRYVGSDLTKSEDGLPLITADMVMASSKLVVNEAFKTNALNFNNDWRQWVEFRENSETMADTLGQESVMLDFSVPTPNVEDAAAEQRVIVILLNFDKSSRYSAQGGVEMLVIKPEAALSKGMRLLDVLAQYDKETIKRAAIADEQEISTEQKFFAKEMPLYFQFAQKDASNRHQVIALEGGKVLEDLALMRPWMVEKDEAGQALPLYISRGADFREVTEDQAEHDAGWLSSIVIRDKVTQIKRKGVVAAQQAAGLVLGQVMPDGRAFKSVAKFDNAELEVMYDKTTPNTLGTRDWLCYRLWVEGELVLDVHPGNPAQYHARVASPSPMQPFDHDDPVLSEDQVAELLDLALTEVDADGQTESLDSYLHDKLPQRVQDFLESDAAESLKLLANDLREGKAEIENGIFKSLPQEEDELLATPAP